MECPNCSRDNDSGRHACHGCGYILRDGPIAPIPPGAREEAQEMLAEKARKKADEMARLPSETLTQEGIAQAREELARHQPLVAEVGGDPDPRHQTAGGEQVPAQDPNQVRPQPRLVDAEQGIYEVRPGDVHQSHDGASDADSINPEAALMHAVFGDAAPPPPEPPKPKYTTEQKNEIDKRFTYHAPKSGDQTARYAQLRAHAKHLAQKIAELTPESREQSLALTHLEQAVMWANAAIARRE